MKESVSFHSYIHSCMHTYIIVRTHNQVLSIEICHKIYTLVKVYILRNILNHIGSSILTLHTDDVRRVCWS